MFVFPPPPSLAYNSWAQNPKTSDRKQSSNFFHSDLVFYVQSRGFCLGGDVCPEVALDAFSTLPPPPPPPSVTCMEVGGRTVRPLLSSSHSFMQDKGVPLALQRAHLPSAIRSATNERMQNAEEFAKTSHSLLVAQKKQVSPPHSF